jgi:hypothetical protein
MVRVESANEETGVNGGDDEVFQGLRVFQAKNRNEAVVGKIFRAPSKG